MTAKGIDFDQGNIIGAIWMDGINLHEIVR